MANRVYNVKEGGMHDSFLKSRAKIQIIGGAFGNGKTAATCIKTIKIVKDYPGANVLMARSTYPKLNDTLRKEFKFWCPKSMLRSFPESKNSDNIAKFHNNSNINFRYIQQQSKGSEQSTSNLLSATYDLIVVDQMEDPEIMEKDFYDLLGRLRGNTVYRGQDPSMPKSGPRWMIMTANPTSNWFYKRIVKPYHEYIASIARCDKLNIPYTGNLKISDDLLCERDTDSGVPVYNEDGTVVLIMELFEASTYENKENLGADFIKTLESTYKGQMKDRFLLGKWESYEGLIYPQFATTSHMINNDVMLQHYWDNKRRSRIQRQIEGYDFGISSPSCYLCGYVDRYGIVHVLDGFHRPEFSIDTEVGEAGQADSIMMIRDALRMDDDPISGDPSIFVRKSREAGTVGKSTADIFTTVSDNRVTFVRGNNDILNGIVKVQQYLSLRNNVRNPYTGDTVSPMIFFSEKLDFVEDEATSYMWAKDKFGTATDKPIDKDDHAMDTLKYMLTDLPHVTEIPSQNVVMPPWAMWHEMGDTGTRKNEHRYG